MNTAVGVDGCRKGWLYFLKNEDSLTHGVVPTLESLAESIDGKARVFIDIPIGLVESGSDGRACDTEARKLLGPARASSVFSAPCRQVLAASDYEEAKKLSKSAIGKMLSKQTFAITPKIREVDQFLRQRKGSSISFREVHPEVCFWALNDRMPASYRKKDANGFTERLKILARHLPNARRLVESAINTYQKKDVAPDDILDALVLLVTADAPNDELMTLPECPPRDNHGLPMEMVYWVPR